MLETPLYVLIFKILILVVVFVSVIVFIMRMMLMKRTDAEVNRLTQEIESASAKQNELNEKLKEADEQLASRKAEADEMAHKMKAETEEQMEAEREKIIQKARGESEEIINKSLAAKDKIRDEVILEMDLKIIGQAASILCSVLSKTAKTALDTQLLKEFIDELKNVDMSQIAADIEVAEILTAGELDEPVKQQISALIKENLKREIKIESKQDKDVVSGAILKFGSLVLDGSLRNGIDEEANKLKEELERD